MMGGREHRHKPRQEISRCLKYLIFFVNFIFWICGITCTILGVYLYAKDFRAVLEAIDFFLNPSILLIACGCIMFVIAFLGCTGALRENVCMLKAFSLCLFFAYVCLVILAFVVFILFYTDTKTGISIQTLLQTGVAKYHDNDNMRELMDYLQSNLGCCGASSQGYKDWNTNQLYNCSAANLAPEQCGVPLSCCKPNSNSAQVVSPPIAPTVTAPTAQSLEPGSNPRCGFHTQDKSITELQHVLYTDGCLQPLQRAFEANAVIIGAVIGAIIVPVCMSVTLSNVLARQVERQKYLLAKEARKEERRRRKHKSKRKDHPVFPSMTIGPDAQIRVARHAMETSHSHHRPSPPVASHFSKTAPIHNPAFCQQPDFTYKQKPTKPEDLASPIYERVHRKKREKKQKSEHRERRSSATPGAGQTRLPRTHHHDDPYRHARSRSEDPNILANYRGPIIVELSSTTHDLPKKDMSSLESLGEHFKN